MQQHELQKENDLTKPLLFGLIALFAVTGTFLLFFKKRVLKRTRVPGKKIDIEIRYDIEKDADTTFSAHNTAKVVKMVLTPLEKQIKKEKAKLILVFGGDTWEMRMCSASEKLRNSVRRLLEAKEW